MLDDVMRIIVNEIDKLYKNKRSYRFIAEKLSVSYSTVENIHKGLTKKPELSTIIKMAEGLGLDLHVLAHESFGLPAPEEGILLSETMKELFPYIVNLSDDNHKTLLLILKCLFEGGDDQDKDQKSVKRDLANYGGPE